MAVDDWNWRYPVELQDVPWDCSAASLCWALNAYGFHITEAEVVEGLGPSRISPSLGLLDASGAGLVDYLYKLGITAMNNPQCSWQDIKASAGFQPMVMGGRAWCHWTGVRIADKAWAGHEVEGSPILLANPAPGYMGISQYMMDYDFDNLGPFSAVWFPA